MSYTDGVERGIPMVMRSADARRSLLDSIINDNPLFDVRITLELESHTFSSLVPTTISERYPLDLRSLRDDLHHSNGRPGWESLLDAIFTALENSEKNAGNSRVNNLNTFEVRLQSDLRSIPPLLIYSGTLSAICGSSTLTGIP